MTLKEQILDDFKEAFKNKDMVTKNTLAMVKSEITNVEIDLGAREKGLKDEDTLKVIKKAVKQRKDAIVQFEKGDNIKMTESEKAEIEVLKKYLPEQSSKEEIEKKIKEIIEKVGADGVGDLGKVMGIAMKEFGATADGNTVREIASKLLG